MATFNADITSKSSKSETLLNIQEAIKEFGWAVMELNASSVTVKAPPPPTGFWMQYQYSTKIMLNLSDAKNGTQVSITATTIGWTGIAKKVIEGLVGQLVNAISIGSQKMTASTPSSVADELTKLSELLNSGVLTQEEFDSAKKRVLGI